MQNVMLIEAFRDFFYYGQSSQMRKAYATITAECGHDAQPGKINWELEEFTFNRLFVGPMAPLAPAIASVYLDPEGLIQGSVTKEIRNFYRSIGLSLEEVGREPEDSLAYELDACRYLLLLSREEPEAQKIYDQFINEHLSHWFFKFYSRAIEHCAESVAVRNVLILLLTWLNTETGKTLQYKETE